MSGSRFHQEMMKEHQTSVCFLTFQPNFYPTSVDANLDLDHLGQIKPYNHKSQDTYTNLNNDGSILEQATIETKENKPDQY